MFLDDDNYQDMNAEYKGKAKKPDVISTCLVCGRLPNKKTG